MYEHYQLKNKTDIYLVPLNDTKSVTVLVMLPAGSRHESEKMRGVSHFIEHMMFKGTKKRENTLALTREIDRLGAEYNAFTGKEYTGYYIKVDADFIETALDILSDMLFNSKFEAKEMEKEKAVIVEEIKMYNDNPLMNIGNIFEEVMYQGCPLGWDIAGTAKHVLEYTRQDVLAYQNKYYQPGNLTVALAGAVKNNVENLIEQYFGSKRNKKVNQHFSKANFGSAAKNERIKVQKKQTDQIQLMIGFPGFKYNDKRNYSFAVLNTILGGSMSSRLFIRIREKLGLAYMIRSGTDNYQDTGYVYVRAGLDARNLNKAIIEIKNEINKIVEIGATKRELDDAKTHLRGSLVLSMEDSSAQASWYVRQALFAEKIESPEDKLKKIDEVSFDDIQKAAGQVFKMDRMRVAVIGDVEVDSIVF
ncbi:MAG: pitrilysin family protein [Patescibacteria group bacterium]